MAKKSTKEKKLRRTENKAQQIREEHITFDLTTILTQEPLETKPEVGDFLKKYVKSIRVLIQNQKLTIYPVQEYSIGKVFVDFLDGHQIICDFNRKPREYYVFLGVEEEQLKERQVHVIMEFVQKLQEFQFIR